MMKEYGVCQILVKFLGKLKPCEFDDRRIKEKDNFTNIWIDSEVIDVRNTQSLDEHNSNSRESKSKCSGSNSRSRSISETESLSSDRTGTYLTDADSNNNNNLEKFERFASQFEHESSNGYNSGFTSPGNSSCTNSDTESLTSDASTTSGISKSSSKINSNNSNVDPDGPKRIYKKRKRVSKEERELRRAQNKAERLKLNQSLGPGQMQFEAISYNFDKNMKKVNQKFSLENLEKTLISANLYESKMNKCISILEKYTQNPKFFHKNDGTIPFTVASLILENQESLKNLLNFFRQTDTINTTLIRLIQDLLLHSEDVNFITSLHEIIRNRLSNKSMLHNYVLLDYHGISTNQTTQNLDLEAIFQQRFLSSALKKFKNKPEYNKILHPLKIIYGLHLRNFPEFKIIERSFTRSFLEDLLNRYIKIKDKISTIAIFRLAHQFSSKIVRKLGQIQQNYENMEYRINTRSQLMGAGGFNNSISGTKICYHSVLDARDSVILIPVAQGNKKLEELSDVMRPGLFFDKVKDPEKQIEEEFSVLGSDLGRFEKYVPETFGSPVSDLYGDESYSRSPQYSPNFLGTSSLSPANQFAMSPFSSTTKKPENNSNQTKNGSNTKSIEKEGIQTSRRMLAKHSPFFSAMLSSKFIEANQNTIDINNCSLKALNFVIHTMSGCKNCSNTIIDDTFGYKNACEVIELANRFLLNQRQVNTIEANVIHIFQNQEADIEFYWKNFFNADKFQHLLVENGTSYWKKYILMELLKKSVDNSMWMGHDFDEDETSVIVNEFIECLSIDL